MQSDEEPPSARRPPCRPYHLTQDQLRRAYQEPALTRFFELLAQTRLEMLRKQDARERDYRRETNDVLDC